MAVRTATAHRAQTPQKQQRELEDLQLVLKARNGDGSAMDALIRRYTGFVRLKSSSYFLAGGDSDDLIQEGMIGLYKAVRDFRPDKETSFRSFDASDHHGDQDGDALQALAAQHIRLVQPHPGRAGLGRRVHARRRASRAGGARAVGDGDLDRGAAEPRLLPRHGALVTRGRRAPPLPRRRVLRGHG